MAKDIRIEAMRQGIGRMRAGTATRADWDRLATVEAEWAHTENFKSRRGIYPFEVDPADGPNVLIVYNNNPFGTMGDNPDPRDQELATLRERLAAAGVAELGFGTYPPAGAEDAGYTFSLVIDADASRQSEVTAIAQQCARETMERIMGVDGPKARHPTEPEMDRYDAPPPTPPVWFVSTSPDVHGTSVVREGIVQDANAIVTWAKEFVAVFTSEEGARRYITDRLREQGTVYSPVAIRTDADLSAVWERLRAGGVTHVGVDAVAGSKDLDLRSLHAGG
jgi:hypothetical protein